jgi:hypothetical protein
VTREEFIALPPAVALGILWDRFGFAERLRDVAAPKLPYPPRYDARIYRKGGFQWASETDLEGLRFWHARYVEGAEKGGQWAAKDKKRADELARWIAWREAFATECWRGTRDNAEIVAASPSRKPEILSSGRRDAPTDSTDDTNDVPFV